MKKYHPGALLVHVARTSGSRQDLAVEGAAELYWNRRYYVTFINQCLEDSKENILQDNLFYNITSEEMIALTCVFDILHFNVCMPMKWLAGNTHNVGAQGYYWSVLSMGKAIDALEEVTVKIEEDGALFLAEEFTSDIFSNIMEGDKNLSLWKSISFTCLVTIKFKYHLELFV